jgi:hypothetical protein
MAGTLRHQYDPLVLSLSNAGSMKVLFHFPDHCGLEIRGQQAYELRMMRTDALDPI